MADLAWQMKHRRFHMLAQYCASGRRPVPEKLDPVFSYARRTLSTAASWQIFY